MCLPYPKPVFLTMTRGMRPQNHYAHRGSNAVALRESAPLVSMQHSADQQSRKCHTCGPTKRTPCLFSESLCQTYLATMLHAPSIWWHVMSTWSSVLS